MSYRLSEPPWYLDPNDTKQEPLQLSESEQRDLERYRAAFHPSSIPIWLNFQGRLVYANPACLLLLRARHESEVVGHSAFLFIHPTFHEEVLRRIQYSLGGDPVPPLEEIIVCMDGTQLPVRESPLALPFGERLAIQLSLYDLSAEKVEQAVRDERRQLLSDVLDSLFAFVGIMTPEGILVEVNRAPLEAAGIAKNDVLGKHFSDTYWWSYSVDLQERLRDVIRLAREGESSRFDVNVLMQDGVLMPVDFQIAPLRDSQGRTTHLIASGVDITARKKKEEDLKRSERQLCTFANSMPLLSWMANPDGWIFWYNDRWYEYTGTTAEQMQGWGWQSVHDPGRLPAVMECWTTAIKSGEPVEIEFPIRGADGQYRQFLTRVHPAKDDDGRVVQWFGTHTDISQQKQTEEDLRHANADLQTFAFAAAHDLQEPMRMVISFTQLLARKIAGTTDEDTQKFMSIVLGNSRRMSLLLESLRAYIEMSREGQKDLGMVDLNRVCRSALINCRTAVLETDAKIVIDPLPAVYGYEAHLVQLFQNLIGNALKYRGRNPPEVHVSATRRPTEWLFCVQDNGVGIEPEYLESIFGVLKRLHGSEVPGSGIGLAICQRAVERLGGRIWAESAGQDTGTTVCFTIPLTVEGTEG